MAESIIADASRIEAQEECVARLKAEAVVENEVRMRGFEPFTWVRGDVAQRHGEAVVEAVNLARNMLHGNAAILEILEDQGFNEIGPSFGVSRTGDFMRFMVAANQLASARIAELCDSINGLPEGST